MSEAFLSILRMSLPASWVVLAVLLFRLVLKKAPKWVHVLLWGLVAVRLVCPAAPESPVSLVPAPLGNGAVIAQWAGDPVGGVALQPPGSVAYEAALGAGSQPLGDGEGGYYAAATHDQPGKPLGFLLLALHWFNPLMWLAYGLLCKDIELACDEKVIKTLSPRQRAAYAQALVACSACSQTQPLTGNSRCMAATFPLCRPKRSLPK